MKAPLISALVSLLVAFLPAAAFGQTAKKTYGSAFLESVPPTGAGWENVTALRYRCRVVQNECREHAMWKIVFAFIFLQGSEVPGGGYELQANVYSNRFIYPHLSRRAATGEVAGLQNIAGESGLFLSIPDNLKNRRVGARTRSAAMFPTLDQEIDGIRDLWKREQVAQSDLTGKTITISITRGEIAEDISGWTVHGNLPAGTYRTWTIAAAWDGNEYRVDFVLPAGGAEFIASQRPMQIATEAFAVHPGALKIYFWDLEVQKLGGDTWSPMEEWKLVATDAAAENNTWGFKAARFESEPVIEASNDGTNSYLSGGKRLKLQ